jgi:hypothetical protein
MHSLMKPSLQLAMGALLFLSACGADATGTRARSAGVDSRCDLRPVGPLIGLSYQAGPEPVPTGGFLADGIYDLVAIVNYHSPSKTPDPPIMRISMRFTTDERSSNHMQGRLDITGGAPLSESCGPGRFAIMGTILREISAGKLDEQSFSTTPDGFTITPNGVHNLDRFTLVFRRRQ